MKYNKIEDNNKIIKIACINLEKKNTKDNKFKKNETFRNIITKKQKNKNLCLNIEEDDDIIFYNNFKKERQ